MDSVQSDELDMKEITLGPYLEMSSMHKHIYKKIDEKIDHTLDEDNMCLFSRHKTQAKFVLNTHDQAPLTN